MRTDNKLNKTLPRGYNNCHRIMRSYHFFSKDFIEHRNTKFSWGTAKIRLTNQENSVNFFKNQEH